MQVCAKAARASLSTKYARYAELTGQDTLSQAHAMINAMIRELDAVIEAEQYPGVKVAPVEDED